MTHAMIVLAQVSTFCISTTLAALLPLQLPSSLPIINPIPPTVYAPLPPPTTQALNNNTFSNSTSLNQPPAPPGFTADIYLRPQLPLNPLAIHVIALECMYEWAQDPWTNDTAGGTAFSDGYNVVIIVDTMSPYGAPLQLQVGHIISGLYEGIMKMLAEGKFCGIAVTLSVFGRGVGTLDMKGDKLGIRGNASEGWYDLSTSNENSVGIEKEYTDPSDPRLKLVYTFTGARIPSKDILTAALDGMANAAVFDSKAQCGRIKAISESASCMIYLVVVMGQSITYAQATKALKWMSATIPVRERMFGEMEVSLVFEGVEVAVGSIEKGIAGVY